MSEGLRFGGGIGGVRVPSDEANPTTLGDAGLNTSLEVLVFESFRVAAAPIARIFTPPMAFTLSRGDDIPEGLGDGWCTGVGKTRGGSCLRPGDSEWLLSLGTAGSRGETLGLGSGGAETLPTVDEEAMS